MVGEPRPRGTRRAGVAAAGPPALLLLGLCGCGPPPEMPAIGIAMYEPIATLDPHQHNDAIAFSVLCNIYDGLVALSPTMGLEPALAISWDLVDASHIRFNLRPGVRFHDASTFSSADVVASWRRATTDPNSQVRSYLADISDMRAEGELAVIAETSAPVATALNRLASFFIVPSADTGLARITEPVGTGSYRWVGPVDGGGIELTAWRGWRGQPAISRVIFSFIDDDQARLDRLLQGRIEVAVRVPDDQVGEVRAAPGVRVELQPRLAVQLLTVCPQAARGRAKEALADPRVRRALLHALDREGLIRKVLRGNATVASQYVHPAVFGYDPGLKPTPHDPAEARRLLAAGGFADGFAVEIAFAPGVDEIVHAMAADLAKVGITAQPIAFPYPELLQRAASHTAMLLYHGWACVSGDASDFFDTMIHTRDPARGFGIRNYSGFSNLAIDTILERAGRESERDRRLRFLQEAQRRVLEELPVLPLTSRWWYLGVSERVEIVVRHDGWMRVADFSWR